MVKYVKATEGGYYNLKKDELRRKLKNHADMLMFKGIDNLKEYEIAFENTIERVYDRPWYEVTSCNIFESLLATKDVYKTIDCIIDELTV